MRLLIIAQILGFIAAELRRSVQICNFSRHSSRKRSTTRQLLDIARSLAVPRQDRGKLMLFETSYGARRCLEPLLRCFLPRCFSSPYKCPIQMAALWRLTNRWSGVGGRPPDTRTVCCRANPDALRVSGGRRLPPDQWFVMRASPLERQFFVWGICMGRRSIEGGSTVAKVLGTA